MIKRWCIFEENYGCMLLGDSVEVDVFFVMFEDFEGIFWYFGFGGVVVVVVVFWWCWYDVIVVYFFVGCYGFRRRMGNRFFSI